MSYAAAAAKGPKQTAEEKRAPIPPEVIHSETASSTSLIDVDTDSVHTVPSDFREHDVKTDTQAARLEREADRVAQKTEEDIKKARKEFAEKEKKAKAAAKNFSGKIEQNSDNPVFIGNAIAVIALSTGLGFGAYRKYAAGELTWKVVAAWTGVVGLFAAGDYYLSQYLFKTRYPTKP